MNVVGLPRLPLVVLVSILALLQAPTIHSQATSSLALMPMPSHIAQGEGEFLIDGNFSVGLEGYKEPRLLAARKRFLETLYRETGIPVYIESQTTQPGLTIRTSGPCTAIQKLGEDESYHLEITSTRAVLSAPNPLGVLHGLQTFLQLVRPTAQGFSVPVVTIDDQPRFPWRGLMIDSGRHFMPVSVIERNLDGMEAVKLNVFHWHLSEDQGFRAESKVYPQLQGRGSNGLYYTQREMREVVEYARERGIRVVPEFDMPCHTTSWFVGYPRLASGPGPYQIETRWGIMNPAMDPTRESTYQFIDQFLGEMTALFPGEYFHIGGDECNGKEWDANPRIQAYMRAHGIKDNAALQSYFTARVQKLVAAHHKIMEGWDEVLQSDTPRDVVIQSWRGQASLAAAARKGNRGILSTGYYVNLNQSAAQHYLVDPLSGDAALLTAEEKARVLGGEAAMWNEYATSENIDSRIWPRTAAIAERLWSPQEICDVASMYERLPIVSQKLENFGLQHRSAVPFMLERMSGQPDSRYLAVLASVVQPPQGYKRGRLRQYTSATPLNRLVDAVPPESDAGRQFNGLVKLIIAGNASREHWEQARAKLTMWRDNDAKLQPSLGNSEITAELIPVSHTLSQVAAIGLQALDDLENHRQGDAATLQSNMQLLTNAEKPEAVLVDTIVPSVELLVQAGAGH